MKFSIWITLLFGTLHANAATSLTQSASNKLDCSQKVSSAFLKEVQREELKLVKIKGQDGIKGSSRDTGSTTRAFEVFYQDKLTGTKYNADFKIAFEPSNSGVKCYPVNVDVYFARHAFHWPQNLSVADSTR